MGAANARRTAIPFTDGGTDRPALFGCVAGRLGVSTATVYKLAARGDLQHVRVSNSIRIGLPDLDAYLGRSKGNRRYA